MKNDLELCLCKLVTKSLLSDDDKIKRQKKFAKWNVRREEIIRILFFDEKFFDIDGVCKCENDRMLTPDKRDDIQSWQNFSQKVMIWLSVCSPNVTALVILVEETVNYTVYIEKVLGIALKYGNEVFGIDWVFQ